MKTPSRKNLFNKLFKGASLATVAIAFQACYGAPRDFGMDQYIEGTILNTEGNPMKDVIVNVNNDSIQYVQSDIEGKFRIYIPRQEQYKITFSETQGSNITERKDTTIIDQGQDISIIITLDK
ncbi:carboxypeptidase regulatory-like domain-containing protein [Dysgonomonas sp. Marseille-P4677]|uniref:carboxypeptidase-like regulatory domain-containing protein n=1 Tax=Dysgonomonas sp. Marseille-P4677 TaxID=2364790 RepID=UPI001913D4D4|nr:carboxypeptidase-like regulatory domain-containing protein [Dysgonomonas sp. Marseille-P4677]MBK5720592.1 carboxypeptidase regulatory-like domain-containing protein [Dysgonomonas sp. Marseille-P4677]